MRIIIETDGRGDVSVAPDGQIVPQQEAADVIDGGGAPQELVELLSQEAPEEETGAFEPETEAANVEDAGAVPDWLVEVIEGSPREAIQEPGED